MNRHRLTRNRPSTVGRHRFAGRPTQRGALTGDRPATGAYARTGLGAEPQQVLHRGDDLLDRPGDRPLLAAALGAQQPLVVDRGDSPGHMHAGLGQDLVVAQRGRALDDEQPVAAFETHQPGVAAHAPERSGRLPTLHWGHDDSHRARLQQWSQETRARQRSRQDHAAVPVHRGERLGALGQPTGRIHAGLNIERGEQRPQRTLRVAEAVAVIGQRLQLQRLASHYQRGHAPHGRRVLGTGGGAVALRQPGSSGVDVHEQRAPG